VALKPRPVGVRFPSQPEVRPGSRGRAGQGWVVLNAPAGKRLAPMLAELAPVVRRHGKLDLDEAVALLRIGHDPVGSSGTVPGRGANRDGPPQPGWTGPPSWPSTTTAAETCLPWAGAI